MKKTAMIAFIAVAVLISVSGSAPAYDRDMEIVADVFIVRPIGLVATVIGAAAFIAALPFSLPSGSVHEIGRVLVAEPFKYTFARPIGDFENRCTADQISMR
jgi:hypothetical protein